VREKERLDVIRMPRVKQESGAVCGAREKEKEREQGAGNWKEGGPDPVWSSVSQTLWP
jgi:hypothetical protein